MNWKKTLLICLAILLVAAAVTFYIFRTEPEAQRAGATKETAMLVDVTGVERGDYRPTIVGTGVVQPAEDILLSPRVGGQIIRRSAAFVPGGFVREGQLLLQIDPADYENTLQLRRSELMQVRADLRIEQGQQDVARQDYRLLGDTLPAAEEALVLREPQLQAVQARIEAAKAGVEQAELALERTAVRAPFNAQVLTRTANVGSQVAPGDALGRLVGVDAYWVMVNVPLAKLNWLVMPGAGDAGGRQVRLRNRSAWPEGAYRMGRLYQLVGALEEQTRLARVIVEVRDPLARWRRHQGKPALVIGEFLEAHLPARPLEDVIRLPRDYLRQNGTVWVMEDDKLRIRDVDIAFRDAEYAYLTGGLHDGDQVVTTNLTTVADGAALRVEADSSAAQGAVSIKD